MDNNSDREVKISNFYQNLWANPKKIRRERNPLLGWHFVYYEKGVNSYKEAIINMNNYVGRLLNLNKDDKLTILDAGCGVGATVIHLSNKFLNSQFKGIALSSNEIKIANELKKENNSENTEFFQKSYLNTDFESDFFDCIYCLESATYAEDKQIFLKEMNRVLKKNGRFVVIDIFRKNNLINPLTKAVNNKILKEEKYNRPHITIDIFSKLLEENDFTNVKTINLLKTKNVKTLIFYGFCFQLIFQEAINEYKKKSNFLSYIWKVINRFTFVTLFFIISKPGYYSIISIKK